ncbi:GvpL/GvpF family gas vesicle protein [Roseisolibacter sp. H3M3-2]|uniref:GvpL/GvpF family gas vesicle protein n=1 Tax=Roseisolibacter sp. H3M3-2 TaxID=3031323 RepID=UPI0023DBDCD2|nr:GvpL/GvpF family gas vesicle protein [Roseisolibacter sp. H3M3-2]
MGGAARPEPTELPSSTTVEYPVARPTAEYPVAAESLRPTPSAGRPVAGRAPRVGLRLYGIVATEIDPHEPPPPAAPDTELVAYRDVAAVVEPAPYVAEPVGAVALERHRAVVDGVFARRTVVPAPPGTVFRSHEALAGWLELHYFTLAEALSFLDDRVVARVTASRADDAASARATPLHLDQDGAAGDERALGDAVLTEAAEPFRELRREAVSMLVLRAEELGEPHAAYASFLVERTRWAQFEQALAREGQRHAGLALQLTGPWPPYDFVRMQFRG